MRSQVLALGLIVAAIAEAGAVTVDGPFAVVATLAPSNGTSTMFGATVAYRGNLVAIGEPPSSLEIFRSSSGKWALDALAPQPDGGFADLNSYYACHAVATDGISVYAGEPNMDVWPWGYYGGVSIYAQNPNWALEDILIHFGRFPEKSGCGLAVDGTTMIVGAFNSSLGGNGGKAYVLTRSSDSWGLQATLTDNSTAPGRFAIDVAVSGDIAVVSDPDAADVSGNATGAVYIFERSGSTWGTGIKLKPADGVNGANFGAAVAISGNTLVVGAPNNTVGSATGAGSAYIYAKAAGKWSLKKELFPPDLGLAGAFGNAVAVNDKLIVVGEMGRGAAHVYGSDGTRWSPIASIFGSTPNDRFGAAVAISDNPSEFIIGAPKEGSGRAYIFSADAIFADNFE